MAAQRAPAQNKPMHEYNLARDKDLIDFVELAWREGKARKHFMEQGWALRLAHLAGDQWLEFDRETQTVNWTGSGRQTEEPDPKAPVRITVNLLHGYVQAAVARWARGNITWASIPATNSPDDQERAQHHDRVLKFLWRDLGMLRKWVDALMWVAVCHNAFIQCAWDPDAGTGKALGPEDVLGPEGEEEPWSDNINAMIEEMGLEPEEVGSDGRVHYFEGKNVASVVPPFEIIPEPHAKDLKECQWVIRSRRRTISYLLERYPKKAKLIEALMPGTNDDEFEVQYKRPTLGPSRLASNSGDAEEQPCETVVVHELWHRPTAKYPQGRRAVVCQDEVLHSDKNPYGELPFVQLRETVVPSEFWATGAMEQSIPVQEALNGTYSKLLEILAKTAGPWYGNSIGSGLDKDEFTAEPGLVVDMRDPYRDVKQFDPPQVPGYVVTLITEFKESLQQLFGQYDVSRGKDSARATSGRAINLLQEANDLRSGPILDGFQEALVAFGSMQLWIAWRYWREERHIWLRGDMGERSYHAIKGGDLVGADKGEQGLLDFDIEVTIERRRSLAATIEQIDFLTQRGWLRPDNPTHQSMVLRAMQFHGIEDSWDEHSADRTKALQENQAILTGQISLGPNGRLSPPLLVYGDHDDSHRTAHLRAMIGDQFDRVVGENPTIRMVFLLHIAEHERQAATKIVTPQVMVRQAGMKMMQQAGLLAAQQDAETVGATAKPAAKSQGASPSGAPQPQRPQQGPSPGGNGQSPPDSRW